MNWRSPLFLKSSIKCSGSSISHPFDTFIFKCAIVNNHTLDFFNFSHWYFQHDLFLFMLICLHCEIMKRLILNKADQKIIFSSPLKVWFRACNWISSLGSIAEIQLYTCTGKYCQVCCTEAYKTIDLGDSK